MNRLPAFFRPTFPLLYRTLPLLKVMGPFPTLETATAVAQSLKQYRGWSPLQAAVFQASMAKESDGTVDSKFAIAARNGVFQDILVTAGLTHPLDIPTHLFLPTGGLNRLPIQIHPYRQHLTALTTQQIPGNHWRHIWSNRRIVGTPLPTG